MTGTKTDVDQPFHVRTTEGVLARGLDTREQAESWRNDADARAAKLGIRTRYEVRENPAA